jgi:carboxypeptidase T
MRGLSLVLIAILLVPSFLGCVTAAPVDKTSKDNTYPFDQYYTDYMTYPDVQAHLLKVNSDHPSITRIIDATEMIKAGATYEGRAIWGLEISNNPTFIDPNKAKVFILGNVHGDEWMGYETCMYTIDFLTDLYGLPPTDNDNDGKLNEDPIDNIDNDKDGLIDEDPQEAQSTFLVDTRELFIIPMPNPDGNEMDRQMYTANGGIWRKNLRDNNLNGVFDDNYDGVDLNRNYPYRWNDNRYLRVIGTNGVTITQDSGVPSSSQYRGPNDNFDDDGDAKLPAAPDWWSQHYGTDWNGIDEDPMDGIDNDHDGKIDEDRDGGFSEPETKAIEAFVNMLDSDNNHINGRSDIALSLTYHSYAGLVLYPWGYTPSPAPDDALLSEVAHQMAAINGYTAERGPDLYPTSGDSDDWFYGAMGTLAYTIEVASIDGGGFHPKPKYIINQSRSNLGVNLYLLEIAEVAKAAKDLKYDTIDIGVPNITHVQSKSAIDFSKPYPVSITINDTDYLRGGSVFVVYRTRSQGGHWGDWKREELMPKGSLGGFSGSIPGQDGGTSVQYYIQAKDVRGPTTYSPQYAHADPYQYNVRGFLGMGHIDPLAIIILIIVALVLLYGGYRYTKKKRLKAVMK